MVHSSSTICQHLGFLAFKKKDECGLQDSAQTTVPMGTDYSCTFQEATNQ